MGHMAPKPHAAAHGKTMQEADNGCGAGCELGVEAIFVRPEPAPIFKIAHTGRFIHNSNIAASAKSAFARGIQNNDHYIGVSLPLI